MERISKTWRAALIAALLGAATLAAFWPVVHNDFIRYDDRDYVTANPHVLKGLSWEGLKWAFTTGHGGSWHPLTWLSHMTDVQMFGVQPGWHHAVSLLFHIANAVLLFLVLRRMSGAEWRSAFVSGLFALHPLHVESVAWAAERKDVLSTLFFLLTLWAYAEYAGKAEGLRIKDNGSDSELLGSRGGVQVPDGAPGLPVAKDARDRRDQSGENGVTPGTRHSTLAFWLALAFFALGLMSKPMLVTVPFVLVLLDFWPLRRMEWPGRQAKTQWLPLMWEKWPFFALAVISSAVTFIAQGRGHAVTISLPFSVRAANAIAAYWKYLGKAFWPADLAIFYPHPATRYPASELWPAWVLAAAALALAATTALALLRRERAPWFSVGWFWYLGMLVPVIGLVQVGQQAMADRYTYLPLVGIFICAVWGVAELSVSRGWTPVAAVAGAMALVVLAGATHAQVKYWRNNLSVFEHALAVTLKNAVAHCHVGIELGEQQKYDLATEEFKAALKADPNCAEAYYGLGYTLENLGKVQEAMEQYRNALRVRPWYEPAHSRLGTVLWSLGQRQEALAEYEAALRQNADDLEAQYRLGVGLQELGELPQAVPHLDYVARLNPDFGDALNRLTEALLRQGKLPEAEGRLRWLAASFPQNPAVRINLGSVLWQRGKPEQAIEQYREALRLNPMDLATHYNLGMALSMQGQLGEAAAELREVTRLKPDYLPARVSLGEALAGQDKMDEAVSEFREAVRLSPTNANLVLNLANGLLMSGRTNEATSGFTEALRLQPDLPEKLAQTAQTLASQGHLQAAIARLTTAVRLKPDAQRYAALARLQAQAGSVSETIASYEQAREQALAAGQKEFAKQIGAELEAFRTQKAPVK